MQKRDRMTRQDVMMAFAQLVSMRSTCDRLRVGVVIANMELTEVFAMGYNGTGRGMKHGCESDEPGRCGCLHAEVNAIAKCSTREPCVLLTTTAPCLMCSKLILNTRIVHVIYREHYRISDGVDVLKANGVLVSQWQPGE